MDDRPSMQSNYSYAEYPAAAAPQKHYPTAHSTSSAFSASANPNEDWTKVGHCTLKAVLLSSQSKSRLPTNDSQISDLAERRRIQNRIAQRNYRTFSTLNATCENDHPSDKTAGKKLKKRLEDLERRAGSSSASPEQRHEELPQTDTKSSNQASRESASYRRRSYSSQARRQHTPEVLAQRYVLPSDDRGMFSQQFTRQLSTSPPPFSYAPLPSTENVGYSNYQPYCGLPTTTLELPLYSQYLPPPQHSYGGQTLASPPIKQEIYGDDEYNNPFGMSYASMANENSFPAYVSRPPHQRNHTYSAHTNNG